MVKRFEDTTPSGVKITTLVGSSKDFKQREAKKRISKGISRSAARKAEKKREREREEAQIRGRQSKATAATQAAQPQPSNTLTPEQERLKQETATQQAEAANKFAALQAQEAANRESAKSDVNILGLKITEEGAKELFKNLLGVNATLALGGIAGAAVKGIGGLLAKTAGKAAAGKVLSTTGNVFTAKALTGAASKISTNTVTAKLSTSFVSKIVSVAKSPTFVASAILGAIGSYPFAGFIKEEALQTLGFAVNAAKQSGDLKGEKEALDLQKEILNPDIWSKIIGGVPYANVIGKLTDFYDSAAKKLEIDETSWEKRSQEVTQKPIEKLSEKEFIDRTQDREDTREQERLEDESYFNRLAENRRQAELEQREEDAEFWAGIQEEQQKRQEEKRRTDDEYFKAVRKQQEDNRKSTLKFGLLGK